MSVKIIVDPGSTHMGKLDYVKELIDVAFENGADAIKFQLFPDEPKYVVKGNIPIPYSWVEFIHDYAGGRIETFFSVFDNNAYRACLGLKSIKFAASLNKNKLIDRALGAFENVYISGDVHTDFPSGAIRLYCIPEYPVLYNVAFDLLFPQEEVPGRPCFDGFSDHTLGWRQSVKAAMSGAKYIEKHIRLDHEDCNNCPDGRFAIDPAGLECLVWDIRSYCGEPDEAA